MRCWKSRELTTSCSYCLKVCLLVLSSRLGWKKTDRGSSFRWSVRDTETRRDSHSPKHCTLISLRLGLRIWCYSSELGPSSSALAHASRLRKRCSLFAFSHVLPILSISYSKSTYQAKVSLSLV